MSEKTKLVPNLEALKDRTAFYREEQIRKIVLSMSGGINTYVYGKVGRGKTTAVKQAVDEFNDSKDKALYVSCSSCATEYAILHEIVEQINSSFPNKILFIGIRSIAELVKKLKKEREKFRGVKVIVLDHVQILRESKAIDSLLDIGFTVILVSDDSNAIHRVSAMSQSRFGNPIHFEDYSPEQVSRIVRITADRLLGDGRFDGSVVKTIAERCGGNIVYAESLLLGSVITAVSKNKECLDECDVPAVQDSKPISHDQDIILTVLKEEGSMLSGALYRKYCELAKFPNGERAFRKYMKVLCEKGLVKAIGTNRGRVYEIQK